MIPDESFKALTEKEREDLIMIPVWITLLVAGADNKYSNSEIKRATKVISDNVKSGVDWLDKYYQVVLDKFEVNVKGYVLLLPAEESLRIDFLHRKIEVVNTILEKLSKEHAVALYQSFRELAYKVAKASGGLFGLLSISYSEMKYIDLKMINNPVE